MDLKIVCASWIKEEDEIVLNVLQASDKALSLAELCERTGLPAHRVERTLKLLKQQEGFAEARKKFFGEE